MVKSEKLYSPQNYIEALTGDYYITDGDDDIEWIHDILENYEFNPLWDYPLSEIDHIVENKLNVVLVDCMVFNSETGEFEHEYRWFEVPEGFEDMKDEEDFEDDEEDDEYIPSAENGDYSPGNPWDAPGMKMSDFI